MKGKLTALALGGAVLALGFGALASSGSALADPADATATTTFSANLVNVGDPVDITGTVLCVEDHGNGVCDAINAPVTVGTLEIQQLKDGADPVACGTAGASFVTIHGPSAPNGSGELTLANFDTTPLGENSITGFRTLYDEAGTNPSNHPPADFAGE